MLYLNITAEFPSNVTPEKSVYTATLLLRALLLLKAIVEFPSNVILEETIFTAPPVSASLLLNATVEFPSNVVSSIDVTPPSLALLLINDS